MTLIVAFDSAGNAIVGVSVREAEMDALCAMVPESVGVVLVVDDCSGFWPLRRRPERVVTIIWVSFSTSY